MHRSLNPLFGSVLILSLCGACATASRERAEEQALQSLGHAAFIDGTFSESYSVAIDIKASPVKIWTLLTDAPSYPTWNTTVDQIEGRIAAGETIKLHAKIAPDRVFELQVKDLVPNQSMNWSDGTRFIFKGARTYTLLPQASGTTRFTMTEVFAGAMLPMIAGSLPDFRKPFEDFAADLKRRAEK